MGVSLNTGTGWYEFTESAGDDTRKIYCSSSTGDDLTGEVGNINLPYATVSAAMNQLRDGMADWVLFKKGDSWLGANARWSSVVPVNGKSADEPILFTSYGTGARPFFDLADAGSWVTTGGGGGGSGKGNFFVVNDLDFYSRSSDPDHGSFDPTPLYIGVISLSNDYTRWIVQGCRFEFVGIGALGGETASNDTLILHRCVQLNLHFAPPQQGFQPYIHNIANPIITDCFFDLMGPNPAIEVTTSIYGHAFYGNETCGPIVARGNIITRGRNSNSDMLVRCGGLVERNLLVGSKGNVSAWGHGTSGEADLGATCTVRENVMITGDEYIYNSELHACSGCPVGQGTVYVRDNIMANCPLPAGSGVSANPGAGQGVNCEVTDNVFYNWAPDGGGDPTDYNIFDNSPGNTIITVISGNEITPSGETDIYGYPDPTRDVADYMASIGETATLEAFCAAAAEQCIDNWQTKYTALPVINFIRAGFNKAPVGDAPSENTIHFRLMKAA